MLSQLGSRVAIAMGALLFCHLQSCFGQAPTRNTPTAEELLKQHRAERQARAEKAPQITCHIRKITVFDDGLVVEMSVDNPTTRDIRIWKYHPLFNGLSVARLKDGKENEWVLPKWKADYNFGAPSIESNHLISKGRQVDFSLVLTIESPKLQPKSGRQQELPKELAYAIAELTQLHNGVGPGFEEVYLKGEGRTKIEVMKANLPMGSTTAITGSRELVTKGR